MGHFYKGEHYSTNSKLGPNERFGIEDDMSFQELAMQIDKKAIQNTKKLETNKNKEKYNLSQSELIDLLKTYEIRIKDLEKENENLTIDKRAIIDRNKNLLNLLQEKKKENENLNIEIKKITDKNKNLSNLSQEKKSLNEETDKIKVSNEIESKNGDFTSGVFIEAVEGKYGNILKFSINLEKFTQDNIISKKGYIYFEVRKAQSGKYYAKPQKYYNKY